MWVVKQSGKTLKLVLAQIGKPQLVEMGDFSVTTECSDSRNFAICESSLCVKENAIEKNTEEHFEVDLHFSGLEDCEIRNKKIEGLFFIFWFSQYFMMNFSISFL